MQRWIRLPDGRFVDANRIAYVGKPETYSRFDEDGNDSASAMRSASAPISRARRRSA